MSSDAYELIALTARYIFAALMLLIVFRAARGALVDSRRASRLRRLSPMTGVCGEFVALDGGQRVRRGMRFPVIREGAIGSSRRADVRIRDASVRRRHALFQLADDGLHVRSHAGARLRDRDGRAVRELTLSDGDEIVIGGVPLLLVLNVPDAPRRVHPAPTAQDDDDDDLFHPDGWEAERSSGSDPVSPIFGREADPFRDPPLVDRPRGQRLQPRPAPRPSRNPGDISPIFDTDPSPAPSDGWASGRRPDRRAFLDDDPDDLFRTDDDSL